MEGWPGGDRAHLRGPCCHHAAEVSCLSTFVALFSNGNKERTFQIRVELSALATCEPTHILEARLTVSPPIFPAIFFFFFFKFLIIFQLEVGQELVLSPCAGLWIYKLIDAGEHNAQATDVITTLIKTITAAHGFCSWGMSSSGSFCKSSYLDVLLLSVHHMGL